MKIFIGNLGSTITERDLTLLFSEFGEVTEAYAPKDNKGDSRGFGYVEMTDDDDAEKAIRALNKKQFLQQFLSVCRAIPEKRIVNQNIKN
jgi:RNA recognition motif-containing protein